MRMLVTLLSRFITWTRAKPYYDLWECAIHGQAYMRSVGGSGRICAACHENRSQP